MSWSEVVRTDLLAVSEFIRAQTPAVVDPDNAYLGSLLGLVRGMRRR